VPTLPGGSRVAALDGMRAAAFLAVFLSHVDVPAVPGGGLGVAVFFTLSGFLITKFLLDEEARTGRLMLGRFYARRAIRLTPALLLVVVFSAACALVAFSDSPGVRNATLTGLPAVVLYVGNWVRAFADEAGSLGLLAHTWSLGIEEQFYLAWPLVLIAAHKWRGPKGVMVVAVLGSAVSLGARLVLWDGDDSLRRVYNGLDTNADQLLIGCALAALVRMYPERMAACCRCLSLPAAAALLAFVFAPFSDGFLHTVGYSFLGLASAATIGHAALARSGPLVSFLAWRPIAYVGRISYGLYLWHFPLALILGGRLPSAPLRVAVVLGCTFLAAAASHHLVEQPLQKWWAGRGRPLSIAGDRTTNDAMSGDTQRLRMRQPVPVPHRPADGPGSGQGGDVEAEQPTHRGVKRLLMTLGVLALALAMFIGGGLWFVANRYGGNIDRAGDVFAALDEGSRPAPVAAPASGEVPVTFLLVGSDTRAEVAPGELPDGRSDAIMIARFTSDRQHAQVISIPRDSWVDIPGHGRSKINAAYAFGGPTLLIQTVEQLTGVRIDHYAAIDFEGLIQVTDDLGGVDVTVAETTTNGQYTFSAGVNHLNGDQARWYLGQRHGLPGGDFDRVRRQQQYLQSMFGKLFSSETFSDMGRLDGALLTVTSAVALDDSLGNGDLLPLAYSLRNVTPETVDFFTAPVMGTGMEGPASVVYLDQTAGERMWQYLRSDSLAPNAAEFAEQSLPGVPR
jgi:LCP family protein required for cell wall assembly